MRRILCGTVVLAILALLSACASVPSVPYDRSTANVINITVLGPDITDKALVPQAATVGQSFGLIGALVDATIQSGRESKLAAIITEQQFSAKDSFSKSLSSALSGKGYSIQFDATQRAKHDYLPNYASAAPGVDAYFDVVVMSYGYLLSGMGAEFRPFALVKCKLIRASDHTVLMENWIYYNPINAGQEKNLITISPNETYRFNRLDDMQADPKKAVAGIEDAFGQIAATIATLLQ